jgi:hypothetical protein
MTVLTRTVRCARGAIAALALASLITAAPADRAVLASAPGAELPPSPADPSQPITDPALLSAIAQVRADRSASPHAEESATVGVEVLTAHTAAVATAIRAHGGAVSGIVDGAVVQATVPLRGLDDVALTDGVEYVRAPRAIGRPLALAGETRPLVGPGLGPVVGANVALTNAGAWQAAGITGAVKVGIIDYFNFGLWNVAEEGPLPDAGHRFCQDTSVGGDACSAKYISPANQHDGYEHGIAVAQIVKDTAPDAELYFATIGTVTDLQAAIDFFTANGVHIVTRSLGAAYDGPGDGTGAIDAVVDYAAARNITWFNSVGNEGAFGYLRVTVPEDLSSTGGYVDFDSGPGVDTLLRLSGDCVLFDGVRWSDWNVPADQRTDYSVEVLEPTTDPDGPHPFDENFNPALLSSTRLADDNQLAGAPPLELADAFVCATNSFGLDGGIQYIRIRRNGASKVTGTPDTLELGVATGYIESGRWQSAYSASAPASDSRNPALVAVGAIDPANGTGTPQPIAPYSSQGPTNDGRIKPDVSAPSCVASTIYVAPGCFSGTSAASPATAGLAALLLDAGVAPPGVPLAAAVKHFTTDLPFTAGGPPDGPDNKYGAGVVRLPNPPPAKIGANAPLQPTPAAYQPINPTRIIDTRPTSPVGPSIGALSRHGILDVSIVATGVPASATAVAVNITITDAVDAGFVQAIPYLRAAYGTSSTLNIAGPGVTKANFAIVPIGAEGKISIYAVGGGNVIVDVLGYFTPAGAAAVSAGRFVAIDPVRTLDTRTANLIPAGFVGHRPQNESVVVPAAGVTPPDAAALVLNVTSTGATGPGFLRAQPNGSVPTSSTVNYTAGVDASNTVIVPVGSDGTVSVYTSAGSHIIADVVGYVTGATSPAASTGLFVAVNTGRAFDSRTSGAPFGQASTQAVPLTGLGAPAPAVPAGASAISLNLTAADEAAPGYLSVFPAGGNRPGTSSLNYLGGQPVANGVLAKLGAGALNIYANTQTNVIVDVNGYFTS